MFQIFCYQKLKEGLIMSRKCNLKILVSCIALVFLISAYAIDSNAQKITLTLASTASLDRSIGVASKEFKKNVEDRTQNRVSIQLAFGGVYGGDREMVEQCQMGILNMVWTSDIGYSTVIKSVGFPAMPYLIESFEEVDKYYFNGFMGDEFKSRLLKGGIRLVSWGENDFRALTNSKRPVKETKDLRGLKIRTPEFPLLMSFFRKLGAQVTPMAYTELFTALQQGTVDGQDNGVSGTYYMRLHEVQKYFTFTNHVYSATGIGISEKIWGSLPGDVQKIISEEAAKAGIHQIKLTREENGDLIKKMKDAGVQFNDLSSDAKKDFRQAAKQVWKEAESIYGSELVNKIIGELKK